MMLTTEQINKANHAFTTTSDIGSLAIGNDEFHMLISNHYGDTDYNHVYIFEDKNDVDISLEYYTADVKGTFNIYNYDCLDSRFYKAKPCITLTGNYAIYSAAMTFVFIKY